jgi:hypothetical protein
MDDARWPGVQCTVADLDSGLLVYHPERASCTVLPNDDPVAACSPFDNQRANLI